ncbi:MAG: hypothetical protein ACREB2_02515, partial [Pseudolabrys sp.]
MLESVAMVRLFRLIAVCRMILRPHQDAAGKEDEMSARGLVVALFGVGVLLGGCMQSTLEPSSEANLT